MRIYIRPCSTEALAQIGPRKARIRESCPNQPGLPGSPNQSLSPNQSKVRIRTRVRIKNIGVRISLEVRIKNNIRIRTPCPVVRIKLAVRFKMLRPDRRALSGCPDQL